MNTDQHRFGRGSWVLIVALILLAFILPACGPLAGQPLPPEQQAALDAKIAQAEQVYRATTQAAAEARKIVAALPEGSLKDKGEMALAKLDLVADKAALALDVAKGVSEAGRSGNLNNPQLAASVGAVPVIGVYASAALAIVGLGASIYAGWKKAKAQGALDAAVRELSTNQRAIGQIVAAVEAVKEKSPDAGTAIKAAATEIYSPATSALVAEAKARMV